MEYQKHPNPEQRDVNDIKSKHSHSPFLNLPVVKILENHARDWNSFKQRMAADVWNLIIEKGIQEWLQEERTQLDADVTQPIIPCDNTVFLKRLYLIINAIFLHNELPPPFAETEEEVILLNEDLKLTNILLGIDTSSQYTKESAPAYGSSSHQQRGIELEWSDMPGVSGETEFDRDDRDDRIPAQITILRKALGKKNRYPSGADAIQVINVLLHEMCHAYDLLNVCGCPDCNLGGTSGFQTSDSGHHNSWLYLAWLVEMAANRAFGFLGTFDLNREKVWVIEELQWEEDLQREFMMRQAALRRQRINSGATQNLGR
ncbi:MAG: hypothetical protein L6R41_003911 [Letrouitia leprolyta]|nr:MAG: hypothetical protein L6R41_003911 [Letrouitia leprolyta]